MTLTTSLANEKFCWALLVEVVHFNISHLRFLFQVKTGKPTQPAIAIFPFSIKIICLQGKGRPRATGGMLSDQ